MSDFSLPYAVELFSDYSQLVSDLWTTYSFVAIGLIGFLGVLRLGAGLEPGRIVRSVATIGFIVFAIGNAIQLWRVNDVLFALNDNLSRIAAEDASALFADSIQALANNSTNPPWILAFHIPIDLCVLGAIWLPLVLHSAASGGANSNSDVEPTPGAPTDTRESVRS